LSYIICIIWTKADIAKPASRLLTLILLLQHQPNQKTADLANSLGVAVRTLRRHSEILDGMGIRVYSGSGPFGGFSLVHGYKMPPLVFCPEKAAAASPGTGLVEETS
jgi:predicted DNA-binding transcriptional regulator YafY